MALAPPAGFSSATKVPAFAIGVAFAEGGGSSGASAMKMLCIAPKTSAGTLAVDTPTFCPSVDDGRTLAGAKSDLFDMVKATYEEYRSPNLYICAVTPSAGLAATAILLFAGTPTAAGSVKVTIAGTTLEVPVSTSDTPTTVAAATAAAINALTDLQATATSSTGTVTITWAQTGTRGNNVNVRAVFVGVTGMTAALNGGSAGTSVKAKFGAGTATAGTLAEDVTNALVAAAAGEYDVIVLAADDTANWTLLRTHLNTYAGIVERKRQRGVVATVKDLANAVTDSHTQNAVLLQVAWHYNADDATGRIAAQVAAGRLWGDGQVGGGVGKRRGVQAYAAANVAGTLLASVREQVDVADQPLRTEQEAALAAGLTPLAPSPANPGFTQIVRSVTNRHKDASGNPDYKVLDTTKVDVMFFCAKDTEAYFAAEYAAKNIAPDPANGDAPRHEDVVYPSMIKADWVTKLFEYRDAGLIVNVEQLVAALRVEIDATNQALVLGYAPHDVIENFHNLAGTAAQVG